MTNPDNYFSLFGLPAEFDINLQQLRQRYRQLQAECHPDRVAHGSAAKKRAAVEQSAHLNDAYQALSDRVARAKHLFSLHAGYRAKEQNLASSPAFLMLQIEAREQLESFKEVVVDEATIDAFIDRFEAELSAETHAFSEALAAANFDEAETLIAKIQLFTKLLSEAEEIQQAID